MFVLDCGRQAVEPLLGDEFKIYGGKEVRPHSWPWQAYLTICLPSGCKMCGGSLVASDKVLTAAHCTKFGKSPVSSFTVRLGTHNCCKPVGMENGDVLVGVKAYSTFNTDPSTFDNDLAILTLDTIVSYSTTISPVCLAAKDPPAGTNCYATGWGYTEAGSSYVLNQVLLPISNDTDCQNEVGGSVYGKICAGAQHGKDTCQGDSGGPLVCLMNNSWQLVGVTSYGNADCGTDRRPGIYTRISTYRDVLLRSI